MPSAARPFASAWRSLLTMTSGIPPLDGFAFDDFSISERDQVVLLEHFTNYNGTESLAENAVVNALSVDNGEVVSLEYQTNFPNTQNPLYNANPNDPSARALYYKIRTAPLTVIDGYNRDTILSKNTSIVDRFKLKSPPYSLVVAFPVAANGYLNVKATVQSRVGFVSDPHSEHCRGGKNSGRRL